MSKRKTLAPDTQASFHCCIEWHLRQSGSLAVAVVYGLAYRISKRSGVYSAGNGTVGDYYGYDRKTIGDAVGWLDDYGLFERLTSGKATYEHTYRVVSHKEWARKHPGRCCEKIEFGWEQIDLGKQLYADSGCRVKFKDFQTRNYLSRGLTDEDIRRHWREFLNMNQTNLDTDRKWRKSAGFFFWEYLRTLDSTNSELRHDNADSSAAVDAAVS